MKSILQSIQPQWCELIAIGKKTIEVRKTKPKISTPFKVYIYQTKHSWIYNIYSKIADWQGKVIGEYICNEVSEHNWLSYRGDYGTDKQFNFKLCLSYGDLNKYGNKKTLYAWHISDLKIYDKPKELSEFFGACKQPKGTDCSVCRDNREYTCKSLTHPPQSWCYVEEV